jgi:hypothetical protein
VADTFVTTLPTPAVLAQMVSDATQMMFSIPVVFGGDCPPSLPDVADGHTVIVPLIGDPLYLVTAKSTAIGGVALASVMFDCTPEQADAAMIEDSLRELTNILAGQLKSLIAQQHQIGLPARLEDDATLAGSSHWAGARLQIGVNAAEVDVAVAEYAT